MARKRKGDAHAGGHGWYVTFADLMALLMAFFVVVAAASSADKAKMAAMVGSMREAFGVQTRQPEQAGIIEIDGSPVRGKPKNVAHVDPEDTTQRPGPIEQQLDTGPMNAGHNSKYQMAATTLRQALQQMPEISEISQNIVIEELPEGVAMQIVDQDGRSMFAEGSAEPNERTREALVALAPVLRSLPERIAIIGHTSQSQTAATPDYGPWEISADRANSVRRVLRESGVPADRFHSVVGRADTEPLYPDNPFLAANRRVTILLMSEAPPVPTNVQP
ncbi:OmpA/MotB family protein [Flaviflagellibacter deserti]|uniref:Flagellar motor protein MotB n=1 Tax=Flaviflagellibacter deserti TaxID=2267266 RepID=A0ABV9YZS6_9HYPH